LRLARFCANAGSAGVPEYEFTQLPAARSPETPYGWFRWRINNARRRQALLQSATTRSKVDLPRPTGRSLPEPNEPLAPASTLTFDLGEPPEGGPDPWEPEKNVPLAERVGYYVESVRAWPPPRLPALPSGRQTAISPVLYERAWRAPFSKKPVSRFRAPPWGGRPCVAPRALMPTGQCLECFAALMPPSSVIV